MMTAIPFAAGVIAVGILVYATFYQNSQIYGRVIHRGLKGKMSLYLTFDDGPHPSATARILEILDASETPAAFFMAGANVEKFPVLARQVIACGQTVGNHTFHHKRLHLKGAGYVANELRLAHQTIARATGCQPRIFRAPHGYRNPFVSAAARRMGYTSFGWTFGVWDTDRPGALEIRRRVRARLKPGAIILLHDGDCSDPGQDRSQTAEALPGIIADAREAGYEFRPLAELVQE
jgi:peptidoglycan/xylan/chitin deacetylase (PgdA/CDA1 family)